MGSLSLAAKVLAAGLAVAGAYCSAMGQWEAAAKLFAGSSTLLFTRDFIPAGAWSR
jgi:hypothetical protein